MVLEAASTDRLIGSWGAQSHDPNDLYSQDGRIIGSRGEWLYDNDPIAHSIVERILDGTLGATGLQFRSMYQADDVADVSDEEQKLRKAIERGIRRGTRDFSFDAGGALTRRAMSKVILTSTITTGSGFSVRCFKPNRPGRNSHATCWRIINSARVSNPNHGPNTERLRDGFALDADGAPVGIYIQRSHPDSVQIAAKQVWDYVSIYDRDGFLNVTHHCLARHADQLRPTGWFTPVIQMMRLFGRTLQAKTVADILKASMGLIVECDDPETMARMDRNGAVLTSTTKILPGKCYYVKKGTVWKTLNFQYNGQDFDKWQEVILTNVCSSFGVPYEFVIQRLTRSNMASARVALLQAYRTFCGYQNDLIQSTEDPWNQSLIREDAIRARLALPGDLSDDEVMERLLAARYLRPPQFMPDPLKEAQAADVKVKRLGFSLSSVYGDQGADTEIEWTERERNDAELKRRGIVLQGDGTVMAPAPGQTDPANTDDEEPSDSTPTPDPQPAETDA